VGDEDRSVGENEDEKAEGQGEDGENEKEAVVDDSGNDEEGDEDDIEKEVDSCERQDGKPDFGMAVGFPHEFLGEGAMLFFGEGGEFGEGVEGVEEGHGVDHCFAESQGKCKPRHCKFYIAQTCVGSVYLYHQFRGPALNT